MSAVRIVHAVVLAGGRGERLGGVDKASLRPDGPSGATMLDRVLAAVPGVGTSVVVGAHGTAGGSATQDERPDSGHAAPPSRTVAHTVEEPRGSGPLSGLAAGVHSLPEGSDDDPVLVLACDLPSVTTQTLSALVAALEGADGDLALGVDTADRDQFLLAAWRRGALASRLSALGDPRSLPVRRLLEGTREVRVPVGSDAADLDTWSDVVSRGPIGVELLGRALGSGIAPAPPRTVPTPVAAGTLAAPLRAVDAMPRSAVSAMDGYALAGPGPWTLVGVPRRAGDDSAATLAPGSACPVATGALVPDGADRVLRHELVRVTGDVVTALPAADDTDDLRPVGEDWPTGAVLLPAGTPVDAAVRSAALACGVTELLVRGPVRARVMTTGDEVVPADQAGALPRGRIRDTAGPALPGVLRAAGMDPDIAVDHCADDPGALAAALSSPGVEVLVLVGATGRGPADHLRPVLAGLGATILVDGVRMRPGGSQIVAALPSGALLLGLPGNPLAAVCAAALTGRLVVDALTSRSRVREHARLADLPAVVARNRTRVLPVRPTADGNWAVAPLVRTAHLLDLVGHPALAVIPESADGTSPVELLRWS